MKKRLLVSLAGIAWLMCFPLTGFAQEADTDLSEITAPVSEERLDALLAPVALYPDALLAQVLMAATYPMDVIEAARWRTSNPDVEGERLQNVLNVMTWDASVKSLVAFPDVLAQMNNQPRWMQELGDAVLADQAQVMARVQVLRQKAQEAGTLASNDKQTVEVKRDESSPTTQYITIAPASPQVVYVPVYEPAVVYGGWWWPSRPVYWGPPAGGYYSSGFYWGSGYRSSLMLWGGFHWGNGVITINAPLYTQYYRVTPQVVGPYSAWWRPAPMYAPPYYYRGGHRVIIQHRPWYRPSGRQPYYNSPPPPPHRPPVAPHPDHWSDGGRDRPPHARPPGQRPPQTGTANKPRPTGDMPNTNNNRPPHNAGATGTGHRPQINSAAPGRPQQVTPPPNTVNRPSISDAHKPAAVPRPQNQTQAQRPQVQTQRPQTQAQRPQQQAQQKPQMQQQRPQAQKPQTQREAARPSSGSAEQRSGGMALRSKRD